MAPPESEMRIFIRDLKLDMIIGIYDHEKLKPQEIVLNLEAVVAEPDDWRKDELADRVCYEEIVNSIRSRAAQNHFGLLESFAHELAEALLKDERILSISISLEKTFAISGTRSVGVELRKSRAGFICTAGSF